MDGENVVALASDVIIAEGVTKLRKSKREASVTDS